MRTRGAAKPQEWMLDEREERNRRNSTKRGFCRQPREQSCGSVGERIAAGIVDRDAPAFQCRKHAARQRAVGRDERCGLVRHLHGLAQTDRDGERLFLRIGGFDDRQTFEGALDPRDVATGELLPALRGSGRPQRLADIAFAPMRGRRGQQAHLFAGDADTLQQRLHRELRMLDGGRNVHPIAATDQLPRPRVKVEVEAGQHDGAAVELGDGGDQLGGRGHGCGRAGGDHRSIGVRGEPRRFGLASVSCQ